MRLWRHDGRCFDGVWGAKPLLSLVSGKLLVSYGLGMFMCPYGPIYFGKFIGAPFVWGNRFFIHPCLPNGAGCVHVPM